MDVDGFMALPKEDSLRFQKMFMLQHFQQFIPDSVFDILTRQFKITSAQNSLLLRSLQANDQRLSLILSEIENLKRQNVELANQNNALLSHNVQLQQEILSLKLNCNQHQHQPHSQNQPVSYLQATATSGKIHPVSASTAGATYSSTPVGLGSTSSSRQNQPNTFPPLYLAAASAGIAKRKLFPIIVTLYDSFASVDDLQHIFLKNFAAKNSLSILGN